MEKILIANRGEIAIRIIRACRTLQISPIVIYSKEDKRNLHIRMADDAIGIGSGSLHDTYMNKSKILNAAFQHEVDAIHPGYSFLSDNSEFAQQVLDAGLIWIGPSPETLKKIENKLQAKKLAQEAGFKTLPDSKKPISDLDEAKAVAKELGYPIIIKPCYGSGGIGLEVVRREEQLENAI
ncbi:MAG: biotin carboxylase N-terminal domain-containing protein, partial [Candidatus Hodarchaeales archaeon]